MQIFLQIFIRYLCNRGLTSTAWCWQPRLSAWQLVSLPAALWELSGTPEFHSACLGQWKSRAFWHGRYSSYYSNRAQGCGSQSPINWESLLPRAPLLQWTARAWLSRDILKGLCAKAWQAATLRGFWDLIVVLFQN